MNISLLLLLLISDTTTMRRFPSQYFYVKTNQMKIKISVIFIFKMGVGSEVFNINLQLITSCYDKYLF